MTSYHAAVVAAMMLLLGEGQCFDPCDIDLDCRPTQECIDWVCVDKQRCDGWCDPHYVTVDGADIHYQGVGLFVMAQYANNGQPDCEGLPDFQVLVEQEHREGDTRVSYIRSLTLILPGLVELNIGLSRQLSVISGAIPAGMNIRTLSVLPSPPRWRGAIVLRIETSFGLVVQFDGHLWASAMIPAAYRNCMEGLCGNADGIDRNDLQTRQGDDVSSLPPDEMSWLIGDSWRVKSGKPRVQRLVKYYVSDLGPCKKSFFN
ncbi:hypothetical protein NP493_176g03015 [Ridgeia piscesae]|uniref:VWFD domain-containing protein n=1 Tax=Ridgeia piscesae TaxID=27915 RepID=A0AAD9P2Z2_RIDPI|nr:hypothetical protein NP493_176g03015 [Ridgeia piscesae]